MPSGGRLVVAAVADELGDVPGEALGVGVVRAAAAMARLLWERAPDSVLLIGSCGTYSPACPIGAAVVSGRLGLADGGAVLGMAYAPLAPEPLSSSAEIVAELGAPVGDVLTVGAISTHPELVAALGKSWQLEHLEAFGAAWACAEAGVPFAACLGVANRVGPNAHAEWLAHRGEAEAAARTLAVRWLSAGEATAPAPLVQ